MELKKFIVYVNRIADEEYALVDTTNKDINIIMMGDYYHDKIKQRIDGFFEGLDYGNIKYEATAEEITSDNELFYELGFNEDED